MIERPQAQWSEPVRDSFADYPVLEHLKRFEGRVWDVQTDVVTIGEHTVERDFVAHTGAVAVIALDDEDRVYLLRQYRHPVGMYLFEPPAGLLDVDGEPASVTASRELAEENLKRSSGTCSSTSSIRRAVRGEAIRVYLARGVREREAGRIHTGEAEEVDLPGCWVPHLRTR